jgi:polyketide cyclase/dehydrase/lipid transport protein
MTRLHIALLCSILLGAEPTLAEVTGVGSSGFEVHHQTHVAAAASDVYAALLTPNRWWDPKHTYTGDAGRLSLDAKPGGCFCESLPGGGWVQHLMVVYTAPGKMLRLRGGLGPLQPMGVEGALTMTVAGTTTGGGSDLTFNYAVGGYSREGFDEIAKAVDNVLGQQIARLQKLVETCTAKTNCP